MFIEAVNGDELGYGLNELERKKEGSDSQRTYILLESGEYCHQCLKNSKMPELGIEKISFQVYLLAEKKLFNVDFKITISGKKAMWVHFPNKVASKNGYLEFFAEVENAATDIDALGLAILANQAAILAAHNQFPADKDSEYFRCMESCDHIEFEPFKLLCYLACTIWADKTPGS